LPNHDRALIEVLGELSALSEVFRKRWAPHDVQSTAATSHPIVGLFDLIFESMELRPEPGLNRTDSPPQTDAGCSLGRHPRLGAGTASGASA
jgi:hypothetical protein